LVDLGIGILGDQSSENNGVHQSNLLFSARYFDSLNSSQIQPDDKTYLELLSAIAYYLGGFPGSTHVMLRDTQSINIDASGIENLILNVLRKEQIELQLDPENQLTSLITNANETFIHFLNTGDTKENLKTSFSKLRNAALHNGNDRELFLADVLSVIIEKFVERSIWVSLPSFSNINKQLWSPYILKRTAIKELWPAQMLLGSNGVFKGDSAVVQMPTSAGKTKSAEIIIRSAILNGRSKVSVIVAPFRALCQEIFNSMIDEFQGENNIKISLVSDVMQDDFTSPLEEFYYVIILTPEKLDFILRHNPEFSNSIGLIIFDEAHLFDDPYRGPKFEMLLASLKSKLAPQIQKILISAVMPNSAEIGSWLIGAECRNVIARDLHPTAKSTAFVNWPGRNGQLSFRNETDARLEEFFVPFLLTEQPLRLKGRETKERFFPIKKDAPSIALALGCRLVQSGSVAIFCGRKDSVSSLCADVVDAFERDAQLANPAEFADEIELSRIQRYIKRTLGDYSNYHSASILGILPHHGSTPQGLRLCVEYALQKEHSKFVICTSTLAQGVNLPIRYLIVTTDRQGEEEIRTRDFHNLIGRAGRAMKYTEGTTIFANDNIIQERWRLTRTLELLDPSNSERCLSRLSYLIEPPPEDETLASIYDWNRRIVESEVGLFLLQVLSDLDETENIDEKAKTLAMNTLAYFQANDEGKETLVTYFINRAKQIVEQEPSIEKRAVFSKSVLSLSDTQDVYNFLEDRIEEINQAGNTQELLERLWPIIYIKNGDFPTKIESARLLEACNLWVSGSGYPQIYEQLQDVDFSKPTAKRKRKPSIDMIVSLCENSIGFRSSLVVGSCLEILQLFVNYVREKDSIFKHLQKMLRYGLNLKLEIRLYELGDYSGKSDPLIPGMV
jgi:superfamily II DNA/RNA helicase